QTNPQFFGRLRLIPSVALNCLVNRLHLQVAQTDWPLCQSSRADKLPAIEVLRQVRGIDRPGVTENGRMLDNVRQFADVARPHMPLERLDGGVCQIVIESAPSRSKTAEQVGCQLGNI